MRTGTVDATQELAAFLRARRERLDPRDFGLPERRQARRTPGLRREEVAELAGVSTDYIVRLEQGRGLRPSPEVLEALARTLRLDSDERVYLFDLAQQRPPTAGKPSTTAAPALGLLVADLSPLPAMLVNHRYDILAWNPEMARLLVDFDTLPPAQRNTMWLCLLYPGMPEDFYVDRETIVREGIADLRAAWAAHPDDHALAELIEQFTSQSEEFARLWAKRDVKVNGRGRKSMRHPEAGLLTVNFEVLLPLQDPDHRLIIYRAADTESQAALDVLASPAKSAPGQ
ncbi:helix-turn-helix transcriptional regulator [Nocardia terpenica]|uniref:Helix-turn-helix domain-containing protein n=1 Tax=Nocardia terpenica TaxID=455432 RepID=A0A6G9ZB10_9NOCA|nr:helix-turn-helix transcriptional regulator [Nocardia terpenica]QIS22346.1 helix-turn-helix domain-containing protein [Nocardia terpenica]